MFRCLLLLTVGLACLGGRASAADRPNVLFIAVDDLRPQLACYGRRHMRTPNIDRLAASGVLFERAYCMVAVCGASRASLMTGIRPTPKRFVTWRAWAEKEAPGITTLNTQFRRNGYYTLSLGKVFHHPEDNAEGWSEPARRRRDIPWYRDSENHKLHTERQKLSSRKRGPAWEAADVPDNAYADSILAEEAIAELGRLKKKEQPFLLAVGFVKPHLPFIAPRKYWDLYDHEKIQPADNDYVPKNAPRQSIHSSGELRAYAGIPAKGPVSDETARHLIHGYYACVSYIDAQVGKLLDELDRLELADNTIVVFWSDHGWNLGEHTLWCKHSCYETSMQIPLIVRAPGIKGGQRTSGLTESIDIYPSLCELAGIPLPDHLQGRSFAPLLADPGMKWKQSAIGRYGRGDTIRTDRFRYSEFINGQGKPVARMLYDHEADPHENRNIVKDKRLKQTVTNLSHLLHEWKGDEE